MFRSAKRVTVVGLCLALGLAACGDDNANPVTTSASDDTVSDRAYDLPASPATDAPDATTAAAGVVDVMIGGEDALVDAEGYVMYIFLADEQGGAASTCTGGCASTWPAVADDGDLQLGEGLDAANFTTVTSESGSQLAYLGRPLYFYAGDSAPGDANGQGIGGVWFVALSGGND